MKELQKLLSRTRAAVERYKMLEDGDRVMVGISGGKDSLALLCALTELRKFLPVKFDVTAYTLDMGFHLSAAADAKMTNHEKIRELCESLGVEYIVKQTEIARIIFDVRREKNPCSLCSRMRRGCLADAANELGCNKLALGHHFDDAAETMMLNLFFEGRIGCFSPVTYMSRSNLTVIRPFVMTEEKLIKAFAKKAGLPVEESPCPADRNTERESMREYLFTFERQHRGLYKRIVGALERGGIDGWKDGKEQK